MKTEGLTTKQNHQVLRNMNAILNELRLLRFEVSSLFSQEKIGDYANATRIKQSYRRALKKYPIALL